MTEAQRREIDVLLQEERRFEPPPEFREHAHVRDASPYERARADREAYWAERAEELHSTLADPAVVEMLKQKYEEEGAG